MCYSLWNIRDYKDDANLLTRLATLEARNAKQGGLWQLLYLPCLFLAYGFLLGKHSAIFDSLTNIIIITLGTAYWQTTLPYLALSGFCVYSVASALFMFPALNAYYQKALEVLHLCVHGCNFESFFCPGI